MTRQFEGALELVSAGYRVFPCHGINEQLHCTCGNPACKNPGKHPVIKGWQQAATTDPEQIRAWWNTNPDFNPGVLTGGLLIVLDVDGEEGRKNLQMLEAEHGPLPPTRTVLTGRNDGGKHRYYRNPFGNIFGNSAGKIAKHLDIRTDGGYVIGPGARHASGNYYRWEPGCSPNDIQEASLPEWFSGCLKTTKKSEPQLDFLGEDGAIPQGERNDSLFRYGCMLRGQKGKTMREIAEILRMLNRERCNPPMDKHEMNRIIDSIERYPCKGNAEEDFSNAQQTGLICAKDVEDEETKFLIKPYIPLGKLTAIQGNPGDGKTAISCALAALVSNGKDLLGIPCEQGNALILSVEDDLSELKMRIEANGGDSSRCFFVGGASALSFNSPVVEEHIKKIGAKLVIFDPFQSFLGAKVDMHRANETRPILAKLADMAARNGAAVIMICHMPKSQAETPAVLRAMGSIDIPAACRSVLQVGRVDDNPNQMMIVQVKCSNAKKGKSILYTIGENARIRFDGYTSKDESNFYSFGKKIREAATNDYYYEDIRDALKRIIEKNPQGKFVFYSDLGFHIPPGIQPKRLLTTLRSKLEDDGIAIGEFKRKSEKMSVFIGPYIDDFLR